MRAVALRRGSRAVLACGVALAVLMLGGPGPGGPAGGQAGATTAWQPESLPAGTALRTPSPSSGSLASAGEPRFVTAVAPEGTYFVDQDGQPILVRGDAPWSLLVDLLPDDADHYLTARSAQGVNAALVSLVGTVANGGPSDDGATVDGLLPFADGDVLDWQQPYFDRAHAVLARAGELGITVLLYPVDSWMLQRQLAGASPKTCRAFGAKVASWAADLPNLLWMSGGDYTASPAGDACIEALVAGIRSTGDRRPFSVQLWNDGSAVDDEHWRDRVDWDFVYTYGPTALAVRRAVDAPVQPRPVLLGEANYEGENNTGGQPTTTETLRRQTLWALTSGAAGDIFGSDDWEFRPGWQERLESPGALELGRVRDYVASLPWWTLRPDDALVRGDRGSAAPGQDVLDADTTTAAVSADGSLALVYLPEGGAVSLDLARLAPGVQAVWVDPSTGTEVPTAAAAELTAPGRNAAGGPDWLLSFRAPAP